MRNTSPLTDTAGCIVRRAVEIPIRNGVGTFHSFHGLHDGKEHFAVGFGAWKTQERPLVRIHSECMTGDVFGSARCDCGDQLAEAVDRFHRDGGILIYLRQEGRGIGLYGKFDAYRLQLEGADTFAANRLLDFPEDMRDYRCAAQILTAMGVGSVDLLSNNPDKVEQLRRYGIEVGRVVNTGVYATPHNLGYLQAKADLHRHFISI